MRQLKSSAFLVFLLVVGCTTNSAELKVISLSNSGEKYDGDLLHFDFCEVYSGELVTLTIDDTKIFSRKLNTPDNGSGFTDSITHEKPSDVIKIALFIEEREWNMTIDTSKGQFICIRYVDSVPIIEQKKSPIYYD